MPWHRGNADPVPASGPAPLHPVPTLTITDSGGAAVPASLTPAAAGSNRATPLITPRDRAHGDSELGGPARTNPGARLRRPAHQGHRPGGCPGGGLGSVVSWTRSPATPQLTERCQPQDHHDNINTGDLRAVYVRTGRRQDDSAANRDAPFDIITGLMRTDESKPRRVANRTGGSHLVPTDGLLTAPFHVGHG